MSPRRVRLLIWKEFTQLKRDPLLIRLLLLMPVLQRMLGNKVRDGPAL